METTATTTATTPNHRNIRIAMDIAADYTVANLIAPADVEDAYRAAELLNIELIFATNDSETAVRWQGNDPHTFDARLGAASDLHKWVAVHGTDEGEVVDSIISGNGITDADDITDEMLSGIFDEQRDLVRDLVARRLAR